MCGNSGDASLGVSQKGWRVSLSIEIKDVIRATYRSWRMILFGLSILGTSQSKFSLLFLYKAVLVNDSYRYGDSECALRIYYPKGMQGPLPAVILYHGTTPKGETHKTINHLAYNLATVGARVYIPELPILKQALVREESLARMKWLYSLIAAKEEVREDRVLVAGFSFAGGLLLKVCTDPQINPVAIICYGSYYDLESALRYFLTGDARFGEVSLKITPHEYARAVFFWNYLDQMELDLDVDRLRECMYRFICDRQDEARAMADSLGERERAFAKMAFETDDKEGIGVAEQMLPRVRDQLQSISPKYFADHLSAPVFLVHGVQDIMVPYTETLALSAALEIAGKEHHVYISRIYSHSAPEGESPVGLVREIRGLIRFLNRLFSYLL